MRHCWAWLALCIAVPANAASLSAEADQSRPSSDDQARLAARLDDHSRTHPNGTWALARQQEALSQQLVAELYSTSPDLAAIERLDVQIRELRRQILRAQDEATAAFYRDLNSHDRITLMKMNYPPPPTH